MKIQTNFFGAQILVGTCQITGRREIETFTCPARQVEQIVKFWAPRSVREAVQIAEERHEKAAKLRRKREVARAREYKSKYGPLQNTQTILIFAPEK